MFTNNMTALQYLGQYVIYSQSLNKIIKHLSSVVLSFNLYTNKHHSHTIKTICYTRCKHKLNVNPTVHVTFSEIINTQ